jgi:hypothetical protein
MKAKRTLGIILSLLCSSMMVTGCESQGQRSADTHLQRAASTLNLRKGQTATPQNVGLAVGVSQAGVTLRKFPYPYQAMLAISPDADHMTLRKFNLVHEFLNTHANTPWGRGLGLDIADSFFMYNGSNLPQAVDWPHKPLSDEFTYFKGVTGQRYGGDIIDAYIHDGWIDTLHSFGDFSMVNQSQTRFSRRLAQQAIQALKAHGDHIIVWTDHGNMSNVDNFGNYGKRRFYNYQQGANPWSPYYHTDLTLPYGVRFVWPDDTSDVFSRNSVLYPIRLPDGHRVWGFWRYTNTGFTKKGFPIWQWSIFGLSKQLSPQNLQTLVATHGYAVLVQHFYAANTQLPLPTSAVQALQNLAGYYHRGQILVARTSRLLRYNEVQQFLRYRVTVAGGKTIIHIEDVADPVLGTYRPTIDDVRGITFYVKNPDKAEIEIGNTPVPAALVQRNPSDVVAPSIGIKWYSPDTTNYAINNTKIS